MPPVPVAFLAPSPRLVLVMHNLHIDLWEIPRSPQALGSGSREGKGDDGGGGDGDVCAAMRLRLRLEPRLEKGGHMACAALSADG